MRRRRRRGRHAGGTPVPSITSDGHLHHARHRPPRIVATTTTLAPTTTVAPPTTPAPTTLPPTTLAPSRTLALDTPVRSAAPEGRTSRSARSARSEIPAIGVAKTMFEGITLKTLDSGPGHWPGTAAPGQTGNMVIAGHRTSHDRPFRDLDKLAGRRPGRFSQHRRPPRLRGDRDLDRHARRAVDHRSDARQDVTLFACHPKGSTRQRIVIRAAYVETQRLTPVSTSWAGSERDHGAERPSFLSSDTTAVRFAVVTDGWPTPRRLRLGRSTSARAAAALGAGALVALAAAVGLVAARRSSGSPSTRA